MVLPIGIELLEWAANLLIDFPNDNIPLLFDEDQWRLWGDELVQCTTFAQNQAPQTGDYDDWNTWAQGVYYNMNNN